MSDESPTSERPGQVTLAVGIAMVGSVFVVLAVWDRIAGLHTLDTRQAIQPWLDEPLVRRSGMSLADLLLAVKVISMVAAGSATAIAVLGVQTLKRSRAARLAMTVLAVPMFLGGLAADGIFSAAVAAAVGTLWFGPARAWFGDGAGQPQTATRTAQQPRQQANGRVEAPPWRKPPTPSPWTPPLHTAYDAPRRAGAGRRPNALVTACLLTWMFCTTTALLVAGSLAILATDSRRVLDELHRQDPQLAERGISDHEILVIGYVAGSVVLLWSLVAAVLAALAFRGRRRAWHALLASTAAVVLLGLVAMLGSALVVVPVTAAVVTVVLLVRPEVRRWFSG